MSVDGKLAVAECSLARKKAECEVLLAERKDLMSRLEGSTSDDDLARLKATIEQLQGKLSRAETEISRVRSELRKSESAKDKCSAMSDDLNRLKDQIRSLEATNTRLKSELDGQRGIIMEKDRHIAELQKQLKKVSAEKDSLLQAQLSAAQHALDTVSIGPQPYDLYRKEYAGDYLTRHKNEFYTAYKRL
eukprot:TRINITY_DN3408_c0_g1_i2.p1 TRINITY_DN3408_c0_g1~~TRINITY_DN3408_c0_g1_i2.p1  ORF type:complete len:190 (-),score=59.25 TRINITY_DN3408_c0_g1_i2:203-772(-)